MIPIARRWVILTHRYLGIALCVMFLSWFVSGIAMIYTPGMPDLPRLTRLERMAPINPALIKFSPLDVAVRADRLQPGEVKLLTIMGRPAFQFGPSRAVTIFADTGQRLEHLSRDEAIGIASAFSEIAPAAIRHAGVLTQPDQWTLGLGAAMPLHKLLANDDPRTVLYVSEPFGEVVLTTTRASRRRAWISAIPHWLYFSALRRHVRLWASTVVWISAAGCLAILLGLVLAIIQYRVRYSGMMRWHYRFGVAFGAVALTWTFSGFLSMQPGDWASTNGVSSIAHALSGGSLDLSQFPPLAGDASISDRQWIRELEFTRIEGVAAYIARGPNKSAVISAAPPHAPLAPPTVDSVVQRIKAASPRNVVNDTALLSAYDAYYYDRDRERRLPVFRLRIADPDRTWVYVDPETSQVLAAFSRRARLERWLYHGLHSFDFPFLYDKRPLWDVVIVALCTGGALLSASAIVIALRRLF